MQGLNLFENQVKIVFQTSLKILLKIIGYFGFITGLPLILNQPLEAGVSACPKNVNSSGTVFKFEENGEWQHGRTIFPYYGTNNPTKIQKVIGKTFWIKKEPRKHRYVYILAKGGERKKIIKSLKHPSETYPKINDTDDLEIHKLEPIESRG